MSLPITQSEPRSAQAIAGEQPRTHCCETPPEREKPTTAPSADEKGSDEKVVTAKVSGAATAEEKALMGDEKRGPACPAVDRAATVGRSGDGKDPGARGCDEKHGPARPAVDCAATGPSTAGSGRTGDGKDPGARGCDEKHGPARPAVDCAATGPSAAGSGRTGDGKDTGARGCDEKHGPARPAVDCAATAPSTAGSGRTGDGKDTGTWGCDEKHGPARPAVDRAAAEPLTAGSGRTDAGKDIWTPGCDEKHGPARHAVDRPSTAGSGRTGDGKDPGARGCDEKHGPARPAVDCAATAPSTAGSGRTDAVKDIGTWGCDEKHGLASAAVDRAAAGPSTAGSGRMGDGKDVGTRVCDEKHGPAVDRAATGPSTAGSGRMGDGKGGGIRGERRATTRRLRRLAGATPALERRYGAGGVSGVFVTATRWRSGLLLKSEAPMAYTGPVRRLDRLGQTDNDGETATRSEDERWQRCQVGRGQGDSETALLLAELNMRHAGRQRPARSVLRELDDYGYLLPGTAIADDDVANRRRLSEILERDSWSARGVFSRQSREGRGYYPYLSGIRQSSDATRVNVVVWWEESAAMLFPVRDLVKGDELVLAVQSDLVAQDQRIAAAAARPNAEPTNWSADDWQVAARQAACGMAACGVHCSPCGLVAPLQTEIARLRLAAVNRPGAVVLDLARLELLYLALDAQQSPPPPVDRRARFPLLHQYGLVRATAADAGSDSGLAEIVFGFAAKRLAFGDLASALRHDPWAVGWHALCFEPPKNLCARVSRLTDALIASHGHLFDRSRP